MDALCYICNEKSTNYRQNLTETKSQHTQKPIAQFVRMFLGDFTSFRCIDSESNCICSKCLQRIDDYDWACEQVLEQEAKLRVLLWATEAKLIESCDPLSGNNDVDTITDVKNDEPDIKISEPNPKQTTPNPITSTTNGPILKAPDTKSIVVSQGVELLKTRPMTRSDTAKRMGPLSLKDVPIGTLLKTKDGKLFRLKAKSSQSATTSATPAEDIAIPNAVKPLRKLLPKPTSSTVVKQGPIVIGNQPRISNVATVNAPQTIQSGQCMCDVCGNTFLNEEVLEQHKHGHEAATTASKIPTSAPSNSITTITINRNRNDITMDKKSRVGNDAVRRKCDVCGEVFRTKKLYTVHYRTHGKACDICDKRYTSLRGITRHMKWHELHPGFVCILCHFRSDDKPSFKEHMALHESKSSQSICVFCDKVHDSARRLRQHCKRNHIKDEQCVVLCDLCGREFSSTDRLRVHKQSVHSNKMPYECAHCSKRFKWMTAMQNHMETHKPQRDRPFACTFCDMRFLRVDHCRVHERRHRENTKTESCPFCSASYEHKFHLKQHMIRKHNAEMPTGFSNVDTEQKSV